jgi:hypothetical protein
MILIHLVFWLFLIVCIYILIKSHEYINAIITFIGGVFIEKLGLTDILFNISTYHLLIDYFYWLIKSNSLIVIIGILITISTCSTLLGMFKQWIKIGVIITILYWFSR